jgi:glycosyltransferase family protein
MGETLIAITKKVRKYTPNQIRWKIGPYIAYVAYFFRMYLLGNKDVPKVLSLNDTLDLIIKNNLSVIRFGDGEMSIIGRIDLGFQKTDDNLAARLKEIIKVNKPGLLICIPGMFSKLNDFSGVAFWFALHHQFRYRHEWLELLSPSQVYGDTLITRPYLAYKQSIRRKSGQIFEKLFSIWRDKNVVLIEGSKSRVGVGNDMFKGVASVNRILGPAENAFMRYNEIREVVLRVSKEKLILISLGPAAKVLAYDLFMAGYRVIDIGHLDMEYEMFTRNEPIEAKVRYKYFNEINERDPEECTDPEYLAQIIQKIL